MHHKLMVVLLALILCVLSGCKDSTIAQFDALGSKHKITLYGCDGKIIGQWESTGNVSNQENSDGWYFEDSTSHKLVEVAGTLVIEQE
jgi:hypothetical protein